MADTRFDFRGPAVQSGLPDSFDGRIISSLFTAGDYGPQLTFVLQVLDENYSGGNPMAWYSLGGGSFTVLDGGLRIGGDQFKQNSKIDLLLQAMQKVGAEIPPGDEASVFEGLEFHWEEWTMSDTYKWLTGKARSYLPKASGDPQTMRVPTKYLGKAKPTAEPTTTDYDDNAIREIIKEVLGQMEGGAKWPRLLIRATSDYPEMKSAFAKKGLAVINEMVADGTIEKDDAGAFKLGVDF